MAGASAASFAIGSVALGLSSSWDLAVSSEARSVTPTFALGVAFNVAALPLSTMAGVSYGKAPRPAHVDHLRWKSRAFIISGAVTTAVGVAGLTAATYWAVLDYALTEPDYDFDDEARYGDQATAAAFAVAPLAILNVGAGLLGHGLALRRTIKRRAPVAITPSVTKQFAGVTVSGRF